MRASANHLGGVVAARPREHWHVPSHLYVIDTTGKMLLSGQRRALPVVPPGTENRVHSSTCRFTSAAASVHRGNIRTEWT